MILSAPNNTCQSILIKSNLVSRWQNGEVEWAERPASASATTRKTPPENGTWRSASTLGWHESSRAREPRRSESNVEGSSGLTWLQRQQQKLRERKEARERVARLPLEWDTASSRQVRRSASHRWDDSRICKKFLYYSWRAVLSMNDFDLNYFLVHSHTRIARL